MSNFSSLRRLFLSTDTHPLADLQLLAAADVKNHLVDIVKDDDDDDDDENDNDYEFDDDGMKIMTKMKNRPPCERQPSAI